MEFKLTIALGNDALQTGTDLATALENVARKLREEYGCEKPRHFDSRNVRDSNGNTVGRWSLDSE